MLVAFPWETEEKCRTLIGFRFGPYSSTVPVNDTLYDSQSNSRAFELLDSVQPLKDAE